MRDDEFTWLAAGALLIAALVLGGGWLAWWLAAMFSGAPAVPGGPFTTVSDLRHGDAKWPDQATWWAVVIAVVVVTLLIVLIARLVGQRSFDRAAKRIPRDAGLRRYLKGTGPTIGRLLSNRRKHLRMTAEDQALVIAGPRVGKTTSIAIPAAVEHPGDAPLVITSNKRDLADAVIHWRQQHGEVWLFDPQGIASPRGEAPWVWNPIASTNTVRGATRLVTTMSGAQTDINARTDAYFKPEGERLLTALVFAAASVGGTLLDVYRWVNNPADPEPIDAVQDVTGGELMFQALHRYRDMPDKQRAGVYSTAASIIGWLSDPDIQAWVQPRPGAVLFNPRAFPHSSDTLMSLSREGEGSAGPLVAALTAEVLTAAEEQASQASTGRLDRPLLALLDEAANVCRWRDLPDLYSHYGSRGIIILSIFQSWAQIEAAFTREGAEKLWSAANVRVYAGGVSDTGFLRRLSELTGQYDHRTRSVSSSHRTGGSRTVSTQRREILSIDTLGALPAGRAIVLLSASRPVAIELIPWWKSPARDRVNTNATPAVASTGATNSGPVINNA